MTLDQIADVIDAWEAHWPEDRRSWRIARADLVVRVLRAKGSNITADQAAVESAIKQQGHLTAFLDKWDNLFADRRVDFVVDLVELLARENQAFAVRMMEILQDKARA